MASKLFDDNVIAVLWDFDKTLIPENMQWPLFEHFGVDGEVFWQEVQRKNEEFARRQSLDGTMAPLFSTSVNYLNHILDYTHAGKFAGLNNELLRKLGTSLGFFKGIPDVFQLLEKTAKEGSGRNLQCQVEHYVVSCGLRQIILGSKISQHLKGVWGCEFEEKEACGKKVLSRISYVLDDTTKTRAIFEINKGSNINRKIDLNAYLPKEKRRVPVSQMIYVADGPSDVPVFSVIKAEGGKGLVVYQENQYDAAYELNQEEKRGDHFALADFSKGSAAYRWLTKTVRDMVDRLKEQHSRNVRDQVGKGAPAH